MFASVLIDDVFCVTLRSPACVTGTGKRRTVDKLEGLAPGQRGVSAAQADLDRRVETGFVVVSTARACVKVRINQRIYFESAIGTHTHDELLVIDGDELRRRAQSILYRRYMVNVEQIGSEAHRAKPVRLCAEN